jgi:hypothetical protein
MVPLPWLRGISSSLVLFSTAGPVLQLASTLKVRMEGVTGVKNHDVEVSKIKKDESSTRPTARSVDSGKHDKSSSAPSSDDPACNLLLRGVLGGGSYKNGNFLRNHSLKGGKTQSYKEISKLGSGGFGIVFKVQVCDGDSSNSNTGAFFALKIPYDRSERLFTRETARSAESVKEVVEQWRRLHQGQLEVARTVDSAVKGLGLLPLLSSNNPLKDLELNLGGAWSWGSIRKVKV